MKQKQQRQLANSGANKSKKNVNSYNKKAGFDVAVEEKIEAGIVLTGDEIKSIRANRMNMLGAYVRFMGGKGNPLLGRPFLVGLHLAEANEPDRSRGLLLSKKEVNDLREALSVKGKTAVPVRLYIKHGWAKVEVGIGPGRKTYQKKQLLKERDIAREQSKELKRF